MTLQKSKSMKTTDIEIEKAHIIVEIIEYVTNSVVSKTILNKSTGHTSVISFDTG